MLCNVSFLASYVQDLALRKDLEASHQWAGRVPLFLLFSFFMCCSILGSMRSSVHPSHRNTSSSKHIEGRSTRTANTQPTQRTRGPNGPARSIVWKIAAWCQAVRCTCGACETRHFLGEVDCPRRVETRLVL